MKLNFEVITDENREQVENLQLFEYQSDFLPDIKSSLILASDYPDAIALAICSEGNGLVGFALYGKDDKTNLWKIYRFMIDREWQGQGFGKLALTNLLQLLKSKHAAREVILTYNQENTVAGNLYSGLGFAKYGMQDQKVLVKKCL